MTAHQAAARAHLEFDLAIEVAQNRLAEAHDAAEAKLEVAIEELLAKVDEGTEIYNKAATAYELGMAVYREIEKAAKQTYKDEYAAAREAYQAEIDAARTEYRGVMQTLIEEA